MGLINLYRHIVYTFEQKQESLGFYQFRFRFRFEKKIQFL
jgi:hypothetical protein